METPMAEHLQRQFDKLKRDILALGARVEQAVSQAVTAVRQRDADLAQRVIDADEQIDAAELDVEEECLHTLACYQPVALDLRFTVSVLKINNDLERIADLAVNIAEQARFLADHPPIQDPPVPLAEMAAVAQSMLKRSLDALVQADTDLAHAVRADDDRVDAMHRRTYEIIEQCFRDQPDQIGSLVHFLSISRQLERIADHAVNIAEDVVYMVEGRMLRHDRPHGPDSPAYKPAQAT
jgi:phosphate transport system protein